MSIGGARFYSVAPIHPDQVEFTSASIVEQPSNGTFEQTGSFAFKYQPKAGFKGADEYAVKVCGHNSQRSGCATVTYRVTVNWAWSHSLRGRSVNDFAIPMQRVALSVVL